MATASVEVRIPNDAHDTAALAAELLTKEAQAFLIRLHREVEPTRIGLLETRQERWRELRQGGTLDFLPDSRPLRESEWTVSRVPADLRTRKVEITGPTDRKMVINALNSGASVYMADFEDANTPTWRNLIEGQRNLTDAIDRTIEFRNPDGRVYKLNEKTATLVVRPRGWHLDEKHFIVEGRPIAGALFDFGLYFFHNAKRLRAKGPARTFTCRSSRATARRACGTRSSNGRRTSCTSRVARSKRPSSSRSSRLHSRWTRSCTSCVITRVGSMPGAGTTCSASSRSSPVGRSSSCPTARRCP
jgi:hypothetical protein